MTLLNRLFVLTALFGSAASAQTAGVAVVELFTSEGCSSCPAADAVLARLHERAAKAKQPVYTLAFHVDYWNRLGWTDRFSSTEFTRRQNEYARRLGLESLYTPQMIVNGTEEFVGSDAAHAESAIAAAQRQAAAVTISVRTAVGADRRATVEVTCTGGSDGQILNVALVEDGLSSSVVRGENAGRQLRHQSVVRALASRPLPPDGRASVPLELEHVSLEQAAAVVYVQDAVSGAVRGAAAVKLP